MYNLARIYYFGIEHKRKISKAISLLKKASYKHLLMADLFLFYIFSNCDDINFLKQKNSHKYKSKCQNHFALQMRLINIKNYDNFQKLHIFIKDYDSINIHKIFKETLLKNRIMD